MLGAQLGLHMGVVELADEGVGPGLARVDGDVHVVLPVALPPLSIAAENCKYVLPGLNTDQLRLRMVMCM